MTNFHQNFILSMVRMDFLLIFLLNESKKYWKIAFLDFDVSTDYFFKMRSIALRHAWKRCKTQRNLLWDGSLKTISEVHVRDMGLALLVVDDSAIQVPEVSVNLTCIHAQALGQVIQSGLVGIFIFWLQRWESWPQGVIMFSLTPGWI